MTRRREPLLIGRRGLIGALLLGGTAAVAAVQSAGCTERPGAAPGSSAKEGTGAPADAIPPPPAGWREVFRDDFDAATLADTWEAFDGRPSSDDHVHWLPSMARVDDGALVLSGAPAFGGWATGAVSGWRMPRIYGLYEIRMRAVPHDVLSYHVLLWPADDQWPPEIDLAEGYRADRSRTDAFIHWREPDGSRRKRGYQIRVDATAYLTWAIEWLPGSVRLLADGAEFARMTGPTVPDAPMWFGMQVEARATREGTEAPADNGVTRHTGPPSPDYAVPVLEVDWVRISEPTGAGAPPPSTAPPA